MKVNAIYFMKGRTMKSKLLTLICLLSATVIVQAGTWTVVNPGDPLTMANDGVLVKASNFGTGALALTINGIFYDIDYSNISAGNTNTNSWPDKFYAGADPNVSNLLNSGTLCSEWGPTTLVINLTGLIIGNDYRYQVLIGGAWNGAGSNHYGNNWSDYRYLGLSGSIPKLLVYTWTATSTTRTIRINSGSGQGNAWVLAYAVHSLGSDYATGPVPNDGATLVDTKLPFLVWDPVSNYTADGYRVYLGTSEPNDLLSDYGLTELTSGIENILSIDPSPVGDLAYGTKYHWVVDAYEPNSPAPIRRHGLQWSFTTRPDDNVPIINIVEEGIRTWRDNMPQPLTATVDDYSEGDISVSGIEWRIINYAGPHHLTDPNLFASVTDTTTDPLNPTANFTINTSDPNSHGFYVIELVVTEDADATAEILSGSDTAWMTVSFDACGAAKEAYDWPGYLSAYDFNEDCLVDLLDLVAFVSEWLDDKKLTESFIYY